MKKSNYIIIVLLAIATTAFAQSECNKDKCVSPPCTQTERTATCSPHLKSQRYIWVIRADVGNGIGITNQLNESMWKDTDSSGNGGLSWSFSTYILTGKKKIGYGIYYWGFYNDNRKHAIENKGYFLREKTNIHFVAPIITLGTKGIIYRNSQVAANMGMGYLHYHSESPDKTGDYQMNRNSLGIYLGFDAYYMINKHLALRMEPSFIYSPINLKRDNSFISSPAEPKKHINLLMTNLEFGFAIFL